jgi:hypothetical protein
MMMGSYRVSGGRHRSLAHKKHYEKFIKTLTERHILLSIYSFKTLERQITEYYDVFKLKKTIY